MTKVKDPISIMKMLIENGYKITEEGNWSADGRTDFTKAMWQYCGKEKCNYYTWKPEWLEEVVSLEDLVQDQPIMVKDFPGDNWIKRHFAFTRHGRPFVYNEGRTSYTSRGVSEWNLWKLPEDETK